MWGKAYDMHRHTGRMVRDSSMRPNNKAEANIGIVGLLVPLIIIALLVSWIMDL